MKVLHCIGWIWREVGMAEGSRCNGHRGGFDLVSFTEGGGNHVAVEIRKIDAGWVGRAEFGERRWRGPYPRALTTLKMLGVRPPQVLYRGRERLR